MAARSALLTPPPRASPAQPGVSARALDAGTTRGEAPCGRSSARRDGSRRSPPARRLRGRGRDPTEEARWGPPEARRRRPRHPAKTTRSLLAFHRRERGRDADDPIPRVSARTGEDSPRRDAEGVRPRRTSRSTSSCGRATRWQRPERRGHRTDKICRFSVRVGAHVRGRATMAAEARGRSASPQRRGVAGLPGCE